MTVHDVASPPAAPASNPFSWPVVAGAVGLAAAAGIAAQLGITAAQPLVGAVVILGIAYACSTNRPAIDPRTVAWGLSLQVVFALVVLKTNIGQLVFSALGNWITRLLGFSLVGATFVF